MFLLLELAFHDEQYHIRTLLIIEICGGFARSHKSQKKKYPQIEFVLEVSQDWWIDTQEPLISLIYIFF